MLHAGDAGAVLGSCSVSCGLRRTLLTAHWGGAAMGGAFGPSARVERGYRIDRMALGRPAPRLSKAPGAGLAYGANARTSCT